MDRKKLEDIKQEQKTVKKEQEELYQKQREIDRLNEGIGTHLRQSQQLFQKTRETFRKNDDSREFDELYLNFSKHTGKTMDIFSEEKRQLKKQWVSLESQEKDLDKELKKLYAEEEKR